MQGAQIWLPNIDGFFMSLGRLLESAEGQRNTSSYDSAEFFSRRLRENERTLVTLTLRERRTPLKKYAHFYLARLSLAK